MHKKYSKIEKKCLGYALRILMKKDYTEEQMTQKLYQKYDKLYKNMVEREREKQEQREVFTGLDFLDGYDAHDAHDAHDAENMPDAPDANIMDDAVNRIMTELKGRGYIDDQRFAQEFIRSQGKKYGEYRIRQNLKRKGIEPNAQMFEHFEESNSEMGVAESLAQKYATKNRRKGVDKIRAGIYSHLMYRGFSAEIAATVTSNTMKNIDRDNHGEGD